MRRVWLFRGAWCVAAVSLLYLAVWLAVPPLLKWQIEKRATVSLGRDVRIGRVAFKPWKLDGVCEDVQIAAAGTPGGGATGRPLLAIARLHLDLAWASLRRLSPVVQALEIDGLQLRVTRVAPGRYDVDDVLHRLAGRPQAPPSEPLLFAVYNLQVRDATAVFDDRPAGRVHAVTALSLAVPFVSNWPAQVDIKVEPRLSFLLNGVPFDSGALATPFAKTRSGELKLKVAGLDVAPYLGYLPETLPVRIKGAIVSTDLAIDFAMPADAPPRLLLQGTLAATNTELTDPQGAPLLAWRRVDVDLRSADLLARRLAVSSVRVEGARLAAERDETGRLNLASFGAAPPQAQTPPLAASAATPSARKTPPAWQVGLDRVDLVDGSVAWTDRAIEPAASLRVDGLGASATQVGWPIARPISVSVHGSIGAGPPATFEPAAFSVEGSATDRQATMTLSLTSLPLGALRAYFSQALTPRVDGSLSTRARLDWSDAPQPGGRLLLTLATGTIDALTLREKGDPDTGTPPRELAAMTRLAVDDARIDVPGRTVSVGRVAVAAPSLAFARGADGRFDFERWLVDRTAPSPASAAKTEAVPWRIVLHDVASTGGRFEFVDARPAGARPAQPLRVAVDDLRFAVQNLAWQGDRPTVPAQIALSGRVGAPGKRAAEASRDAGSFDWRGVVGIAPLLATGSLRIERIPVHLFMPYVGRDLGLRVARAELGYTGQLSVKERPGGLDVDAGADMLFGAVRIESTSKMSSGETLLSWNTLGLKDLRVSLKPGLRPQIDIGQAALDDFYTRLRVGEDGKLDLSSVGIAGDETDPPRSAATATPSGLPVDIRLDETLLTHGRIDFSDHFVRPNYSAALTELTGRLGTLRTDGREPAALTIRGKAAGTALLDIGGTLNPMARPLTLDLHAKATDLELAPLSPYAGKYAGYAIERGKLSMDVSYRLGADGRLEAKNQVVLNQLTFGEKIDSPTATKLPVLLAVALLKDRNGVIDLDLPISGSLDDPQFSVAGIVGRLLGNLLRKAVTSPFSLLTAGGGGAVAGGEPGRVEFVAGTTRLAETGREAVDKVAQALVGKPKLVLTVTGIADAAVEQDAYRSAVLDERLEAARKKQTVATAAGASAPAPLPGTAARDRLLEDLYDDSDLPDKPRNFVGVAKRLPVAEMEARLKANVPVDADAMRALALNRGVSVRDALIARGLEGSRVFLAAPRLHSDEPDRRPFVRLSLGVD